MLVLFLLLVGIGALWTGGLLALHYRSIAKAKAAETWPTVTGKIVTAWIISKYGRSHPGAIYTYTVGEKNYRGGRIRFGSFWQSRARAEEVGRRYSEGATPPVHYNPEKPRQSVLEPAPPTKQLFWFALVGLLFPFLALAVGLLALFG